MDANSTSPTDVIVQTTCPSAAPPPGCPAQTKTFRVGAVINATSTNPISNIFGWQFQVTYDPSKLLPQADPSPLSFYPDGAGNTVQFGSQTTPGTVNWGGKISAGQAFGSFLIIAPGELQVFYTIIAPNPAVTVSAKTLMANVAFEILKPTTTSATSLTLSNIEFQDSSANPLPNTIVPDAPAAGTILKSDPKLKFLNFTTNPSETWSPGKPVVYDSNNDNLHQSGEPVINGSVYLYHFNQQLPRLKSDPNIKFVDTNNNGVWDHGEPVVYDTNNNGVYDVGEPLIAGSQATESVTNDPPVARFTATQISPYVYSFDATGSSDGDGTIADPAGYFWDFGDGTQDLGVSGSIVLQHNFTAAGRFNVTLRVVDNLGASGSARDGFGGVILNSQPSHTYRMLTADKPPVSSFTFSPANPVPGGTVNFDGTASSDPDGTVSSYTWDFGDGSSPVTLASPITSHIYTSSSPTAGYSATLTVTDDLGSTGTKTQSVIVKAPNVPPSISNLSVSTNPTTGSPVTLTITASDPDGLINAIRVDWGDGTIDNLSGSQTSPTHTYATSSNFVIKVTVTDDGGLTDQKTTNISVAQGSSTTSGSSFPLPGGPIPYIAIGAVAAAAVAFYVVMRRRGKAKPAEPGTP